jgi:hypothetical protein
LNLLGDSKTNVTVSASSPVFKVITSSFPAHLIIFAMLKKYRNYFNKIEDNRSKIPFNLSIMRGI